MEREAQRTSKGHSSLACHVAPLALLTFLRKSRCKSIRYRRSRRSDIRKPIVSALRYGIYKANNTPHSGVAAHYVRITRRGQTQKSCDILTNAKHQARGESIDTPGQSVVHMSKTLLHNRIDGTQNQNWKPIPQSITILEKCFLPVRGVNRMNKLRVNFVWIRFILHHGRREQKQSSPKNKAERCYLLTSDCSTHENAFYK